MTFAEVLAELVRRANAQGRSIKGLADDAQVTQGNISRVIHGHESGTWKTVSACLRASEIDYSDCLTVPPENDAAFKEEKEILDLCRRIPAKDRALAIQILQRFVPEQIKPEGVREGKAPVKNKGSTKKAVGQ